MPNSILFDNAQFHFSEHYLPTLISYENGVGGSHFSVTMLVDLFLGGSKILMLTAYPMAKDNIMKQLQDHESKITYITNVNQLNLDSQAIILESGNEELFLEVIHKFPELQNRVILIKNMEVFSDTTIEYCLTLPKIILSGDIDKCTSSERISEKLFTTTIFFSQPKTKFSLKLSNLKKYSGYLWNKEMEGIVSVTI